MWYPSWWSCKAAGRINGRICAEGRLGHPAQVIEGAEHEKGLLCRVDPRREDLALYAALIARLRERSEVLTEFIGESTLEDIEAATMTDFDIYERDMALLHQADAVVAECSTPSLGVGYELGSAHALGLPVYILYRPREGRRLSAMVSGNRGFTLLPYGSREEALAAVNRILDELGV